MSICPRCLKDLTGSPALLVHTCTPTPLVRDLEARLAEWEETNPTPAGLLAERKRADNAEADLAAALAREATLREAITWALGINGDFRLGNHTEGRYYWRKELAKRAGIDMQPHTATGGDHA